MHLARLFVDDSPVTADLHSITAVAVLMVVPDRK
jgi:hypothetical protein